MGLHCNNKYVYRVFRRCLYNARASTDNISTHCYVNLFLPFQNAFANVWDLILQEKGGALKKNQNNKKAIQPKKEVEVEIVVLRRR